MLLLPLQGLGAAATGSGGEAQLDGEEEEDEVLPPWDPAEAEQEISLEDDDSDAASGRGACLGGSEGIRQALDLRCTACVAAGRR